MFNSPVKKNQGKAQVRFVLKSLKTKNTGTCIQYSNMADDNSGKKFTLNPNAMPLSVPTLQNYL